jgi:hypothetical protein
MLTSVSEQTKAIDDLIPLARHHIRVFDQDLSQTGWNSALRAERISTFLREARGRRLDIIVHDTRYLETACPRMVSLLRRHEPGVVQSIDRERAFELQRFRVEDRRTKRGRVVPPPDADDHVRGNLCEGLAGREVLGARSPQITSTIEATRVTTATATPRMSPRTTAAGSIFCCS